MNRNLLFSLLILALPIVSAGADSLLSLLDKPAFYDAMASDKLEDVDAQLTAIKASSANDRGAYEGALLMKKAGLVAKAKEKLSLFKEGKKKLEAFIKNDNDNAEYCFLRLIIQEHAPKALNYKDDIDHDSKLIRSNYKTLPAVVQQAIAAYSKKSKALKGLLP